MSSIPICAICGISKNELYLSLASKNIFECSNCSNAFTFPWPEPILYENEDFHGQFNFNTIEDLPNQWKTGLIKQLSLIQKHVSKNSNVLEIGCGQGLFLNLIKDNGYNVYGIEPSATAANIAKSRGLEVINGYFPQTTFDTIDFDLIIMSHVLEHIENPLSYLDFLSKKFKGKYLLLIQTNYKGLVPTKLKENWYAWVPDQHFSHFTEKGLKKVCQTLNLKFVKAEYSSLEHNGYWLSKLSQFLPRSGDQFHSLIQL